MTLASLRQRGALALASGLILLLGLPLYQDFVLAPNGYIEATNPIVAHHQFGSYLLWASAHMTLDIVYHLVQCAVFVLAFGVPTALRRVLWPSDPNGGKPAMWLGQLGFALYALTLIVSVFATPNFATTYARQHASALSGYLTLLTFKTLLTNVLGGGLIALFLILMSLRGSSSGRLPGWLAYLGLATGGLLGASAILYLFALTQPDTALSPLAFLGMAFWLVAFGFMLLRVEERPREETLSTPGAAIPSSESAPPP